MSPVPQPAAPPERLSKLRRLAYSLGMPGYLIGDRVVVAIALFYYLPPPGRGLQPQVSSKIFLGVLTVFGMAMLVGRVFDCVADPLVGFLSDRSRSRFGRRRVFLLMGMGPMLLCPALLFWPLGPPGSTINGIGLALLLSLYFISFTVYVAPYLSLIPELAQDGVDRTRLSTLLAAVSFPVLGLYGAGWPVGIELGRTFGLSTEEALRAIVLISLGLAILLCLAPVLAINERRHTRAIVSDLSFRDAFMQTLRNRPFLLYLGSQLLSLFGTNLVTPVPVYLATVILGRSEGFAGALSLALFATTLIGFLVIGRVSALWGAKRTLIGCNVLFGLTMAGFFLLDPDIPGGVHDPYNLMITWSAFFMMGIPVAGFLVLPNVLISQIIDYDAVRTGEGSRAAMHFGLQGFLSKWMLGISSAVLALLFLRFGNSPEQPLGVLLIGPFSALACFAAAAMLTFYPERRVLQIVDRTAASAFRTARVQGP